MATRIIIIISLLVVSGYSAEYPVQEWRFDTVPAAPKVSATAGPIPPEYPFHAIGNQAAAITKGGRIVISDPGTDSIYDFDNGDEITVEAMVRVDDFKGQAAILTKGRTNNPGVPRSNQNWAFRLRSNGKGEIGVNFLFRSRAAAGHSPDWHRWTSTTGFGAGTGWHHVAISYRFGDPDSICGYIDGQPVTGRWDMGGATTAAPVVDDDEVWIGSSLGGDPGNSLYGAVDDIALYRSIVPAAEIATRYRRVEPPLILPQATPGVLELSLHPWGNRKSLPRTLPPALDRWQQDALGFVRLPQRYDDWGVRIDWGLGAVVRAVCQIELEPGDYEFLGRSRGVARLFVDGEKLLDFHPVSRGGGAHNKVVPLPQVPRPGMRPHALDDVEKIASYRSRGGRHTVIFDVMVGGPGLRLEFGEGCLALAKADGDMFRLVGPEPGPELTDDGWETFSEHLSSQLNDRDRQTRRAADQQRESWSQRHHQARQQLPEPEPHLSIDHFIAQRIRAVRHSAGTADSFFNREVRPLLAEHCYRCHGDKQKGGLDLNVHENILAGGDSGLPAIVPGDTLQSHLLAVVQPDAGEQRMPPKGDGLSREEIATLERWIEFGGAIGAEPSQLEDVPPITDDLTFLRRIWIDTLGITPPLDTVKRFAADPSPDKRSAMVERLLADDRWADNWVGYWQDVLAENPNLLKPNLNNTGPFRYWILESILDNKPMDRFATELITMRGSTWGGGAAGFAEASQNDVPMAAKAHILGTAFLGVEMKCARCHDSPYHETTQQDLFQLAAMLANQPLSVPTTSSVPASFFDHVQAGGRQSLIEVSLPIGSQVEPAWPFADITSRLPISAADTRHHIAAQITQSRRFAEVIVNRVWARYLGAGLVEKVDDWEGKTPSHPALLSYLTDEFIRSGYDLKALARQIFSSQLYQREPIDPPENLANAERYFEGPYRRRMSAEQIVDSAWHVSGRTMDLGLLTMDMEGRLKPGFFTHFGSPKRAWEFATLANERDRPSLAMPKMQAIVDVLLAFGWRNSRQEPTSYRLLESNPLQPGILANGTMGSWLTRLTDDSEVTQMCRETTSIDELTTDLYLRYLTRYPTASERQLFRDILTDGFDRRLIPTEQLAPIKPEPRYRYVSWMNHLHTDANTIKQQQEADARRGPEPTRYLQTTWREAAEDAIWALFNSPEMVVIP